jgi:hypothetical protein
LPRDSGAGYSTIISQTSGICSFSYDGTDEAVLYYLQVKDVAVV